MQGLDAAVAGGEERAVEQRGATPVALPVGFDAQCGFRLPREGGQRAQLGRARNALGEKAITTELSPKVVLT